MNNTVSILTPAQGVDRFRMETELQKILFMPVRYKQMKFGKLLFTLNSPKKLHSIEDTLKYSSSKITWAAIKDKGTSYSIIIGEGPYKGKRINVMMFRPQFAYSNRKRR